MNRPTRRRRRTGAGWIEDEDGAESCTLAVTGVGIVKRDGIYNEAMFEE